MSKISVNKFAWDLLALLLDRPQLYGVVIQKTKSGTTLIDMGIKGRGGLEAGRILTEISMGGCGKAQIRYKMFGKLIFPSIFVYSDLPIIATLGSQYAGWRLKEKDYSAIGSGPARALALKPKEIYKKISYSDNFDQAILILETDIYPSPTVLKHVSTECGVAPEKLAVILVPTSSIAGGVQIAGRVVETAIHRLVNLGLEPSRFSSCWGSAPIPPPHPDFTVAMARTNDAIMHAGIAYFYVHYNNERRLNQIVNNSVFSRSPYSPKSFFDIFEDAERDFYKIDPAVFAPAVVFVNNLKSGKTIQAGELNLSVLTKSFTL